MIKDLIALDGSSRVWIYPSTKEFSYEDLDSIRPEINDFLDQWTSHNRNLISYGNIFHKRFLALFVDESFADASGCSIDKSVHFVQYLSDKYHREFFNRTDVYLLIDEQVIKSDLKEIPVLYKDGVIDDETLFFDNLIKTKDQFLSSWIKPISEGWLKRFV